ncbi:MAG: hypothetical protein QY326_08790 [Bdellovibrionota bacterium]|nr:MAG: hypothetical protein QY326_08790 [Bdellovibrionota bacterium]
MPELNQTQAEENEDRAGRPSPLGPSSGVVIVCCSVLGIALLIGSIRAMQLQLSTPRVASNIASLGDSLANLTGTSMSVLEDPHASSRHLRMLADKAELLALGDESGEALCLSWRLRVEALRRDPNESPLLLELAARAGSASFRHCDAAGVTPASIAAALDSVAQYALNNAPYDMSTLRVAGVMLLQKGHRQEGLKALNTYLTFATQVPPGFEDQLLSSLSAPSELLDLVPARFPQVIRWSDRILSLGDAGLLEVLTEFQKRSVDESARAVLRGELPLHVHGQRLFSLLSRAASDEVRSTIDRELVAYFSLSGNAAGRELFAERAPLRRVPIVTAFLPGDTRVQKTALAQWVSEKASVALDSYFNTVGFFVPEGSKPKVILLQSHERSRMDPQTLQLLRSSDNQIWEEVAVVSRRQFDVERRTFLMLTPQVWGYPYWKLHFKSPQRNNTFTNDAGLLLQVYGG